MPSPLGQCRQLKRITCPVVVVGALISERAVRRPLYECAPANRGIRRYPARALDKRPYGETVRYRHRQNMVPGLTFHLTDCRPYGDGLS